MVSKDEIKHLGWLSRLELTNAELDRYVSQIDEIIRYFDKLDTIPLSESEWSYSTKEVSELRDDTNRVFKWGKFQSLKNRKDGFIKGPKMS
jgi:aspartyl-tRNA(Asn)/glutamyl-tRNA(Gln) amidotransferase subunit C